MSVYLLVASLRYEDTNELSLCHCNAAATLEGTLDYLFKIFDDGLRLNQKLLDEIDGCPAHNIDDPGYVDYIRKRNVFLLPYVSLRDKIKRKVPLTKADFSDITTFGVNTQRPICLYLSLYELESYERAFDVVEVTIDMLGYWDEYFPKLKETTDSIQLFNYLYEATNRYNNSH